MENKWILNGMANPEKMEYSILKWENQFINGFGTEMHSSSTFEGHLFGGSIGYSIEDQKWSQYLLNSGDSDLLIVPDSKRIFSLSLSEKTGPLHLGDWPESWVRSHAASA